jgi:uncharacterized membrane protein YeiB
MRRIEVLDVLRGVAILGTLGTQYLDLHRSPGPGGRIERADLA